MSNKIKRVKEILLEIKNKSEPISGGSGDTDRFQMQKPMLYWKLGKAIQEICEEQKIAIEERKAWVKKHFRKIDNEIWQGHRESSYHAYKYVHELIDEDVFVEVIAIAGHKFNKFRRKRVDYILSAFSQRNPTATKAQQAELVKRLGEKDLTHNEFLDIKKKILKSSIPIDEIRDLFDQTFESVETALENPETRKALRMKLGSQLISQISYILQLLKMTTDKVKFEKAFTKKVRNELNKDSKSNSKETIQLFKYLRACLNDSEKSRFLLQNIDASELSELNTNLFAIESEENFEEYRKSTEALAEVFK
jgi:hypothetical protein